MKTSKRFLLIVICGLCLLTACQEVPITGRRQFNLVPDSVINSMSFQSYNEFLSQNPKSGDSSQIQLVKTVGNNIKNAVQEYFAEQGQSSRLEGYEWEFNLIENDSINAWAMPGGKVVVYTGLLDVTRNPAELAVVMGHEVAHAVAEHGSERMSQELVINMGGLALSQALSSRPAQTQQLFMKSYGLGTQVGVLLPYSRRHETEADKLGLIFMAMAGYDPREAVGFWQRMSEMKDGAAGPELLSTHPSDRTRINNIREFLPEALEYFK